MIPYKNNLQYYFCLSSKRLVFVTQHPFAKKTMYRIVTFSHAFSRAWHRVHILASSFDWLIGLCASVVIGQCAMLSFWFHDNELKTTLTTEWSVVLERETDEKRHAPSPHVLFCCSFNQSINQSIINQTIINQTIDQSNFIYGAEGFTK